MGLVIQLGLDNPLESHPAVTTQPHSASVQRQPLRIDQKTTPGSVVIDQYVNTEGERRRPDVLATYDGKPTAFEIQLATTQLPIIVDREMFYSREGYRLIWITWNFQPIPRTRLLTAFEDIFYSHNKNLFSLDDDVIRCSHETKNFMIRAFWYSGTECESKLFKLSDLSWLPTGLAYAESPEWHHRFIKRWLSATRASAPWDYYPGLLADILSKLRLSGTTVRMLEDCGTPDLINCMLSLQEGIPIASHQSNLRELLNTFLSSPRRHRYALLLQTFFNHTARSDLLGVDSVRKKFEIALSTNQEARRSDAWVIASNLFPDQFNEQ